MIELDNFNFDEEVAKFNDVIFNQSNEVKAKILTGYLTNCAKFPIYNLRFRWGWIARLFVIQVFLDFLYIPELHQLSLHLL